MHGTIGGQAWANTFWLRNGNGVQPSATDFANAVADFHGKYIAAFLEHLNVDVLVNGCNGLYYGETGADLGFDYTKSDTGSMAGAALPSQVSTGISWAVQAHYRGGHPRTYLPPCADTVLETTRLFDTSFTAAVRQAANDFHAAVNALVHGDYSGARLGTVSFQLRNAWRTPPIFRDYIPNQAQVDQRIDTQRRRLGRDL